MTLETAREDPFQFAEKESQVGLWAGAGRQFSEVVFCAFDIRGMSSHNAVPMLTAWASNISDEFWRMSG